jgi:TDG/mug DNA glycosylase family protein
MLKPTKSDLLAARNKTVADIIAEDLRVLFCGINPGLYSAAIGCHFGRPGNRFWPIMHLAGFTPRLFSPYDQQELVPLGYGITNFVMRATATADELSRDEFIMGGKILKEKIVKYKPQYLAVLGVGAYQKAFHQPKAKVGLQKETIGTTKLWILPNPSGLNAHYQKEHLVRLSKELREETVVDA